MGVSRRGFVRALGRELARGEGQPAGQPTARAAGAADLERLAAQAGLQDRLEDLRRLARPSVRLTHDPHGRSRLGGEAPRRARPPAWRGEELAPLAQVSLRELTALEMAPGLAARGALLLFYARATAPSGLLAEHLGAAAALLSPREPKGGRPARLSVELSLPRVWHASAQALGLSGAEQQAWQQVRAALAGLQGVQLERPGALHRLFGYPDETRGAMPLTCELLARGHDVADGHPDLHPQARAAGHAAGRWRLLLQLSRDEVLGWSWGAGDERLYLWQDADPQALGRVVALIQ